MQIRRFYIGILAFLLFLFSTRFVYGQDSVVVSKIRSLEKEYLNANAERKADIELDLSEYYWQVQPEKGIAYGKKAIASYHRFKSDKEPNAYVNTAIGFYYTGEMDSCIKYTEEMLRLFGDKISNRKKGVSNNILCVAYRRKGDYNQALKRGEKAIEYFNIYGDSIQIAGTLDNIASIYKKWGKYEDALGYSIKSLSIFESIGDTSQIAVTLFNIGDLYSYIKDYKSAAQYLYKAEEFAVTSHNLFLLADIYNEFGVIYKYQNEFDKADSLFQKSLRLYYEMSSSDGVAMVQQNRGSIAIDEGRYQQGLDFLKKSLLYFESINSLEDISEVYIDLGRAYNNMNRPDSAAYFLNHAVKISEEINNVNVRLKALKELKQSYSLNHNYEKAIQAQDDYYTLKDSLRSADVEVKLAELTRKYNLEKAENETERWKNQQQIEASKNRIFLILIVGLLLFILLASFFVWQRRKKDQEIIRLRYERDEIIKNELQEKMRYQSKQLTTHALSMLQKNELLQSMQQDINRIREKAKDEVKPELRSLNNQIQRNLKGEKDWDLFKMYFEQINKGFFDKLREINPNLTSSDMRLIALIKLNMNIKEVASVLNLSPNSVKNARYRLRKKLNLSSKDDLFEFIYRLS